VQGSEGARMHELGPDEAQD